MKNRREILREYLSEYYPETGSHGMPHITAVRARAEEYARDLKYKNLGLVDTAAALHDIGNKIDRKNHHLIAGQIIRGDRRMKDGLTEKDFEDLIHAVEEHRSSTGKPTTTLAKIIADADSTAHLNAGEMLKRSYSFQFEKTPGVSEEDAAAEAYRVMQNKYGREGYGYNNLNFDVSRKRLASVMDRMTEVHNTGGMNGILGLIKAQK